MRKCVVLFFVVFFISCQGKKERIIDSVVVWYYNGIFERAIAVSCDEIVYLPEKVDTLNILTEDGSYLPKEAVILESVITDNKVLEEIGTELKKLRYTENSNMDARMKCHILFTNGQIDSLCVGSEPICANYNGQPVEITSKLLHLIRENCGFYRWIGTSL